MPNSKILLPSLEKQKKKLFLSVKKRGWFYTEADIRTLPLSARCLHQAIEFTGRITGSLGDNGQRGPTPVTRHLYAHTQGAETGDGALCTPSVASRGGGSSGRKGWAWPGWIHCEPLKVGGYRSAPRPSSRGLRLLSPLLHTAHGIQRLATFSVRPR